jgi:ubiquinone/menaquinone biosynthesis C-methylase UbiE
VKNPFFEQKSTMEKWDADYYHSISQWFYNQAISDILRLMDVNIGATVLDAGCGFGVHTIRVANAGYRVCAIDISKTMLDEARHRVKKAGVQDGVEFHQMDLRRLSFDDASFSYAFSWGVVIHIPEAERSLDELSRIIKPGGKLALYLTNKTAFDHKIKSFARFVLRKPYTTIQNLPLGDRIWYEKDVGRFCVWQFQPKAIVNYITSNGFRLLKRRIGELSEIQRHLKGFPRQVALRINNVAYRFNFPPAFGTGNLFVFEKNQK